MGGQRHEVRPVGVEVPGLERLAGAQVHPGPLGGAHVVVHGLGHQAVAEAVAARAVGAVDEDARQHGRFQSLQHLRARSRR